LFQASRPDSLNQSEASGREDTSDEGQQQQDRGQRHAPLGREEESQPPACGGDEERAEEGRPAILDGQAGSHTDPLADEAHREQQDCCGDRTKMSLKPVMSRNCSSSCVGRACCLSMYARNAVAASAVMAPAATASSISFWLYILSSLKGQVYA
jgi:hypothetical protein